MQKSMFGNAVSLSVIALFTALMAVSAQIMIPATVPFTLQNVAVVGALLVLGGRRGTVSVILYLILGAIGVPLFAGFRGGIAALFGATGGFLIGLLAMALIYSFFTVRIPSRRVAESLGLVLGQLACYLCGTIWFALVYVPDDGTARWLIALPYFIPDAIKLAIAMPLFRRLRRYIT